MNRLSDATLNSMTKKELIEYVRMCEHNYDVAEETLRQQAENVKDWRPVKRGKWIESNSNHGMMCSSCCGVGVARDITLFFKFCPFCGAYMRGDENETN